MLPICNKEREKLWLLMVGKFLYQKNALKIVESRTSLGDLAMPLKILAFLSSQIFH